MEGEVRKELLNELIRILGKSKVLSEKSDLIPYMKDTYRIRFDEDYKYLPDLVVLPETTSNVQEIVRLASKYGVPLIPKGGGSNRTGMLVPIFGGIVIDTIKMDKIVEIDQDNLSVTVQPGITLKELEERLSGHGLALNQEQGSLKVATVGGSISTHGYSRKHNKYGIIADRIMSLEVVLANGDILRTGPKVLYTSTGYRVHQLFVGAEGTLGIITEATLRVEPLPEARDAILAFHDGFWSAYEAARRLVQSGLSFVGSEAYQTPDAVDYGAPDDKNAIFFVMLEGTKGEVDAQIAFVKEIVQETGGTLAERENAERYSENYTMQWCGTRALTGSEDSSTPYIPLENLREFYDRFWNDIIPRHGLIPVAEDRLSVDIGRYGMAYGRYRIPENIDAWEEYQKALREIASLVTELGGSISGCHGVGIEHRDNLDLEFSEIALETMRRLKKCFDPQNIMNPGKKIPMKNE